MPRRPTTRRPMSRRPLRCDRSAAAADPAPAADPTPVVASAAPAEPTTTPDPFNDAVHVKSTPSATPPAQASVAVAATPTAKHSVRPKRRTLAHAVAPAPVVIPLQALAFDPQAWLHDNPASPTGAAAVQIAEHYLGVPYVWGGAQPSTGFDCSGLTSFVYDQLGVTLPHYAAAQFDAYPKLDPSELQPGDLVFFEPKVDGPGHVAIYIGNDQIIEAPHTGALIRIVQLLGNRCEARLPRCGSPVHRDRRRRRAVLAGRLRGHARRLDSGATWSRRRRDQVAGFSACYVVASASVGSSPISVNRRDSRGAKA